MCEILYTSIITFFTTIYTTFIIQTMLEKKKLLLNGLQSPAFSFLTIHSNLGTF